MKRIAASIAAVALLVSLGACGNSRGTVVDGPVNTSDGKATIKVKFRADAPPSPVTDTQERLFTCTIGTTYPDCLNKG